MDQGTGVAEGCPVGAGRGLSVVGTWGWVAGAPVGETVGSLGGWRVGSPVGWRVGSLVGMLVGVEVGVADWRAGFVVLGVTLGRTTGAVGLLTPVVWSPGWVAAVAGRTSR